MAKARCEVHGSPNGRTQIYSLVAHYPLGFPFSGIVCGRTECREQGIAWLTLDEERAYERGERIFQMDTGAAKVQVQ